MRKIIAYKDYFGDFLKKQSKQDQLKIVNTLDLLSSMDRLPSHYIKYIRDGLYEFRITCINTEYRVFFIYDGDTVVVLFNAIKKKTQKLPNSDVEKALRLKQEYYGTKGNQ